MKKAAIGPLVAGLLFSAACFDAPTEPRVSLDTPSLSETGGAGQVTVMTQNLYVGADVDAVIAALMTPDPNDDVPALFAAIETLAKTDFPTRAGAIADEIARKRPHVVGFQEVSEIHINLAAIGGPVVDLEFLPIIEAQLAARGLHYTVAATIKNIDATPAPGIELVDYDAMLVNTDRASLYYAYGQNFTYNLGQIAPGVELKRGFIWAGATIGGKRCHFVSAHLEPDLGEYDLRELRAAQAAEIAGLLTDSTPAFVMGDLNDRPGSLMYQVLQQAGFHDVWQELRPEQDGYTAGEGYSAERPADLSNDQSAFTQRIDYVWARGMGHPVAGLQGWITLFGALPSDRVEGPYGLIWPSDHAGLVAELSSAVALGLQ